MAVDGFPGGLYGPGMHDYVLWEAELGARVATAIDNEQAMPGSWLIDLWMAEEEAEERGEHLEQETETDGD